MCTKLNDTSWSRCKMFCYHTTPSHTGFTQSPYSAHAACLQRSHIALGDPTGSLLCSANAKPRRCPCACSKWSLLSRIKITWEMQTVIQTVNIIYLNNAIVFHDKNANIMKTWTSYAIVSFLSLAKLFKRAVFAYYGQWDLHTLFSIP